MGSLDKYARKQSGEKRTKHVGSRIEPSLYDDFIKLCDLLGLTTSETVRYMIVNTVNEYRHKLPPKVTKLKRK